MATEFKKLKVGDEFVWNEDPKVDLTKMGNSKASRWDKTSGELRGTTPVKGSETVVKKK